MAHFDFIVVGSGLAGLYAAYRASSHGSVAILTKSNIRESNSYFAQGGIAAVTESYDSPELHYNDTLEAGRGLCDHPAVNVLVNEGPERVMDLIEHGMLFDKENGVLSLGLEGGHHRKRILHAGGDATGKMITDFVISQVEQCETITVFDNHAVLELLQDEEGCFGVRCWDFNQNQEEIFTGDNTFLATGGTSAIYARTTNPHTTIGDGLALSYRAGCIIQDIEFIQFHPTALYCEAGDSFLVSEAVRGEGAYLVNQEGERFMVGRHELAELAPRDTVARAIYDQMRTHNDEFVYLTLNHLDPEVIRHRFPTIFEKCASLGIDMCDRIPVAPAAHYTVGGVRTDLNGQSGIPHLYICGELASVGIMGANRLASNSLLECLVFGYRAVEDALQHPRDISTRIENRKYHLHKSKESYYLSLKNQVARIMTLYAGITRTASEMKKGLARLKDLTDHLALDPHEYYYIACSNLLTVATLVMTGALFREESRGGHFRSDYPEQNNRFACHSVQQKGHDISTLPVNEL